MFHRAAILLVAILAPGIAGEPPLPAPLKFAHAHNDYEHIRPLFDALDHGFTSVEADIFLVDGKLLIGHNRTDLKPERTLETLYLEPLRARAKAHAGRIFPESPHFWLLIDTKTEAKSTYAALHELLSRYADLLSEVADGKPTERPVTVVVSGNCDRAAITGQAKRFAGIDGRPPDLESDAPAHLIPWVSDRWGNHFKWSGEGPMPAGEQAKLRDFVARAHRHGRLVRFWATPEKTAVWQELRSASVDLINTDQLAELQKFLASAKE
jgi:hypothetical protein